MKKFKINIPQLIMLIYLMIMFVSLFLIKIPLINILNESIVKLVMNGVFVLALIPMINCGIGMNFGLPIGITAGLIGMCISIQFNLKGAVGLINSMIVGVLIAIIFGYIYALLLNKLKGKEEIIGVFCGFSFIPLMSIFWVIAPFTNRAMLYPVGGKGLRPKISLNEYFGKVLDDAFLINLGSFKIPLGLMTFYVVLCLIIYYFYKTKIGKAMRAVGENETFAKLSGVDIDKTRTISIILSMVIAAIGICVYSQSYGFLQLYDGAFMMAFSAICAILIGGASGNKATIANAIIGTYLFQTTFLISVPVANAVLVPQIAEIVRTFVTNGIILFAFIYERRNRFEKI